MKIYKDIFGEMSRIEFENLLTKNGIQFERVPKGEGGIVYKGKTYTSMDELDKALLND